MKIFNESEVKKIKTLQDLYNYYKSIPAEQWITGKYRNGDGTCRCALGWIEIMGDCGTEIKGLLNLAEIYNARPSLATVNDGKIINLPNANKINQIKDPKSRVLEYLQIVARERKETLTL